MDQQYVQKFRIGFLRTGTINMEFIYRKFLFVLKLLRPHNQSTSFLTPYLKRTQIARNMHLCSSCVPNLIKM